MSIFKNNFVVGVTAALAATIIAPVIVPAIKRSGRPIAKSLVKGGLALYEMGREAVANTGEVVEDVVAEVRAEQVVRQAAADDRMEERQTSASPNGNGSHYVPADAFETSASRPMEGGRA